MRRGEIWTVAGGPDCAGKPRPVVIVQDDRFAETNSVTVCLLTTNEVEAPLVRLLVEASLENGLRGASRLMVDKMASIPRTKLGARVGRLSDDDAVRLNGAMVVFLGLASGAPRPGNG